MLRREMIQKAYRYRLYPDEKQKIYFAKSFGCVRFIWNRMLDDKKEYYRKTGKLLYVTPAMYKKEYPFLREVDSLALANVQLDLKGAYTSWLDGRTNPPKHKVKKKCRDSYTTNNQGGTIMVEGNRIKLPKIKWVKAKIHRAIPNDAVIKSATVSRTKSGNYYCSVLFELDEEMRNPIPAVEESKILGLDYSSGHFYVDNNGHRADAPHWLRDAEKKLVREQKKLSRMLRKNTRGYDGHKRPIYIRPLYECKNIQKQQHKVAVIHEKVSNARKNWCHQESRKITNSCDAVILEDIDLRNMGRSLHLGKATHDNGFGMFRTFLTYKMKEQGKYVIKVSKTFPSSQLCSCCGSKNPEVKNLKIRKWECPSCHAVHDRDENAALNLKQEGMRILSQNVMILQ